MDDYVAGAGTVGPALATDDIEQFVIVIFIVIVIIVIGIDDISELIGDTVNADAQLCYGRQGKEEGFSCSYKGLFLRLSNDGYRFCK